MPQIYGNGMMPPQVQPEVQATPTERMLAARVHQLTEHVNRMTGQLLELQNRKIAVMNLQVTGRDANGRIQQLTMVGELR